VRLGSTSALLNNTLVNNISGSGSSTATTGVSFSSAVTSNSFSIGGLSGAGDIALMNNAVVQAAITLDVGGNGLDSTYSGVLSGSGSLTKNGAGTTTLAGSNTFTGMTTIAAGKLTLSSTGGINSSSAIQVDAGATFDVSARTDYSVGATQTLRGNGTVIGLVDTIAGGTIAPGTGIGTLTVNGDAILNNTLAIEYDGSAIDKLVVSGTLNISAATVDFNSISPLTSGPLVFASYDNLIGSMFSSVLDLPAGFAINYNYLGSNQIALVRAGDFDGDGDVDGADFVAWQTHFPMGSGATTGQGDADGDSDVDGADFAAWQSNFPTSPASASPVPEPKGWVICGVGCLAIAIALCGRRSRRLYVA
jgi:autotransporter-associated beta strand protein